MKITLPLLGIVGGTLLTIAMMNTWERPPMKSTQIGPDGIGMVSIENPRRAARIAAANQSPAPEAPVENDGALMKDNPEVYKNVQVLGDLDTAQFNRLMVSISNWIVPVGWKDKDGNENNCNYCHNPENLASDEVYTKVVARRMIQMTRQINSAWQPHVVKTGVTCYTCHRGQPIPANIWFQNKGPAQAGGTAASREGQNLATAAIGYTAMQYDPFTTLLAKGANLRVVGKQALPTSTPGVSIKDTEKTYALMMNISKSLGVGCVFCHNSRMFGDWTESRPQRVTAWHGIHMSSDINETFMASLQKVFPANRLGPQGDVAKVGCATCHNGVNKPLYGVSLAKDYPELSVANP